MNIKDGLAIQMAIKNNYRKQDEMFQSEDEQLNNMMCVAAMGRDAAILGMTLFNVAERELTSIHAALVAGLANGTLNPVVGQELPLADAPRAHEEVMKPGAYGKIVLIP